MPIFWPAAGDSCLLPEARSEHKIADTRSQWFEQSRDGARIMLAIRIDLHQSIVAIGQGKFVAGLDVIRSPYSRVGNHQDAQLPGNVRRAVHRAVIDHQQVSGGKNRANPGNDTGRCFASLKAGRTISSRLMQKSLSCRQRPAAAGGRVATDAKPASAPAELLHRSPANPLVASS